MTGVVRAWRELVDAQVQAVDLGTVAASSLPDQEELDGQQALHIQRAGGLDGQLLDGGGLATGDARRQHGDVQDVIAVVVLKDGEDLDDVFAVGQDASTDDAADLQGDVDQLFDHPPACGLCAQRSQRL
ncbi:MAG: hypothetical protein ACI9MC_003754 [Kiritimatiellia bacterium]